jgi:hypothetical protein
MRDRLEHDFVTALGIMPDNNPAACSAGRWIAGARSFDSINPASGEPIARVSA